MKFFWFLWLLMAFYVLSRYAGYWIGLGPNPDSYMMW